MKKSCGLQLVFLSILVLLGTACNNSPSSDKKETSLQTPVESPVLAQVGDSVYTLERLQSRLELESITLSRARIEAILMEWVDAQIYIAEAIRLGALQDPVFLESLERVQNRLFKGHVQQKYLDEKLDFSEKQIKAWVRNNGNKLLLKEEQLRVKWYMAQDSNAAAELLRAVRANRLRRDQLAADGVQYGEQGWLSIRDISADLTELLFDLEYLGLSALIRKSDGWYFYQLTGKRPKGFRLSLAAAREEVLEMMRQEVGRQNAHQAEQELLKRALWKIDLDPFYDAESVAP